MKAALANVLKEDIIKDDVKRSDLTSDCYFVHHDGQIDIVRAQSSVKIFDYYYDKGFKVTCIEMSGGHLNPKLTDPNI